MGAPPILHSASSTLLVTMDTSESLSPHISMVSEDTVVSNCLGRCRQLATFASSRGFLAHTSSWGWGDSVRLGLPGGMVAFIYLGRCSQEAQGSVGELPGSLGKVSGVCN